MMTYRSAEEWELRFGRERISFEEHSSNPFYGDFAVESYLENHANKFTGPVRRELLPVPLTGVGPVRSRRTRRLAEVRLRETAPATRPRGRRKNRHPVSAASAARTRRGLKSVVPDVEFVPLDCIKGHDSFLVDMDAFRPVIGDFLETFNNDWTQGGVRGRAATRGRRRCRSGRSRSAGARRSPDRCCRPCRVCHRRRPPRPRRRRSHSGGSTG